MYVEVCKGETENNDHSTRDIQSKQWIFYRRFSKLARFYNCIIMDACSE